jgi:hypothetical protein
MRLLRCIDCGALALRERDPVAEPTPEYHEHVSGLVAYLMEPVDVEKARSALRGLLAER